MNEVTAAFLILVTVRGVFALVAAISANRWRSAFTEPGDEAARTLFLCQMVLFVASALGVVAWAFIFLVRPARLAGEAWWSWLLLAVWAASELAPVVYAAIMQLSLGAPEEGD